VGDRVQGQTCGLGDALGHVANALRSASGAGQFGRLGKIEGVGPQHHRAAAGGGFDEVLATQRGKTAAQHGDMGQAVVQRHLAQRVAQPYVSGAGCARPGAAAGHGEACLQQQLVHLVKPLRVARHDEPLHGEHGAGDRLQGGCFTIDSGLGKLDARRGRF